VKVLIDTSVYIDACRSADARARFRTSLLPLLPVTYLTAVVAYELRVNALDRDTRGLVDAMIHPLQRAGRVVAPVFADWVEASEVITTIERTDRSWRSQLPALLNDVLIALSACRIGATVVTHNARDFRLIQKHRPFSLRAVVRA
jgi:predicted nucleic acid-binding protein